MFKFLKEKLANALNKFKKGVAQAPEETVSNTAVTEEIPAKSKKKESFKKELSKSKPAKSNQTIIKPSSLNETLVVKGLVVKKTEQEETIIEKPILNQEQVAEKKESAEPIGMFAKITQAITTKKISAEQFSGLFWDLEVALLENNVALEVIEKLRSDLSKSLVDKPLPRNSVEEVISESLRVSLKALFLPGFSLAERVRAKQKKPFVIVFVGVNGSGKTTSIAKITQYLIDNGLSVVLAAGDTFRAAAIDQLQLHADKLGVRLIKHSYGSDAAAVAFDAIKHAESQKRDVVLIDTAGRLHTNTNLMDEIKKVVRIAKPDLKLFVGEAITGNDCVEQAREFDSSVGVDGVVLAKADIDEKGGAAVSVSYVTKKPILFLGTGQEYADLEEFSADVVMKQLGVV